MAHGFVKLLPQFLSKFKFDNISLQKTNFKETVFIKDQEYRVPTFRIVNPKNLPFSYNSLIWRLIDYLDELNKLTSANLKQGEIKSLVIIDDFSTNDFYLPERIEKRFMECVDGFEDSVKFELRNIEYLIDFKFIVDSNFEIFWYSSDQLQIDISLERKKCAAKTVGTGKENLFSEKEIKSRFSNLVSDYPEVFENKIWPCISDNITEYETFVDGNWQYVYLNFNIII